MSFCYHVGPCGPSCQVHTPAPLMTGPHKCPDCGVWWVGFEHRCRVETATTSMTLKASTTVRLVPDEQVDMTDHAP